MQRTPTPLALELLVHGVAGAAPEELLGDPRTVRVTGDATAAVFRRTDDADAEAHPARYTGRPVPEAYCWSRLTSGNGARALWLLLPFMVAHLAHWARPAAPGPPRAVRAYGVLVRLVALSLTVLLIAAACEVCLDLVAWQCAGSAHCAASRSWLGPLATAGGAGPGRRLALAALLPAALTGLLWYLSNRTWSAYESQPPPPGTGDQDGDDGATPALGRPGFWYGRRLVARPRAAHPCAPPCYAERAVPDLTWRMTTWTGRTGGRLVVSGHSQGSVLAAAAVWQLPPAVRHRVALLTYGSPLTRLYGRWFPAYFGPAPLRALHRDVDCWRNLWRATDPIGGPVLAGTDGGPAVDRGPLADPLAYGRTPSHPLPAPILGHGDYQADPVFAAERDALLVRLAARTDVPPPRPRPGPDPVGDRGPGVSREPSGPADPPGTAG
ncbi:hypothetical protein [Streptomyces sp. NPDC090022]|uniref:hypothetical protein n=1 Tax=Streptomyces sp. NPDC090022 TaxID=3365920 RepID=UPI003805887F